MIIQYPLNLQMLTLKQGDHSQPEQPQVFHSSLTPEQSWMGFPNLLLTMLCSLQRQIISSSFFVPEKGPTSFSIVRKWVEQSLHGQNWPKSTRKAFHFLTRAGVNSSGKLPVIMCRIVQPICPNSCLVILCSPSSINFSLFSLISSSPSSFQKGSMSVDSSQFLQKSPSSTISAVAQQRYSKRQPTTKAKTATAMNPFLALALI